MGEIPHRYEQFGIQSWHGRPEPMERVHSHSEIELNLVERGELRYVFGAQEKPLAEGGLYVFGGLEPHRLVRCAPGTVVSWATVPAYYFTGWELPERLGERILSGALVRDGDRTEFERDPVRFARWRQDLARDDPRFLRVVLLEIRARLERLALGRPARRPRGAEDEPTTWSSPVAVMMACMLRSLTDETLDLSRIAGEAGLNRSYASTLFRRKTGRSPIGFLTQQRLAYARFLLATSDRTVLDIAYASGFGSPSQFYAAFKRAHGCKPGVFRRAFGA